MVGKDQRSRHPRRGSRRVNRELAEVATQVAQAAVESEAGEEQSECLRLELAGSLPEAWELGKTPACGEVLDLGSMLPTIDEEKRLTTSSGAKTSDLADSPAGSKSPAHLILQKLPTPVRGSPRSKDAIGDSTPKSSQGGMPAASKFGALSPAPAAQPGVRGPEPWGLPDPAAVPQSSQKCGYREWLQARGQQAMQRSFMPGAVTARSPTAATTPVASVATAPAPTPALSPSPGPAAMGTAVGTTSLFGGLSTPPSASPPTPAQAASWGVHGEYQLQQWFGSPAVDMQAWMPGMPALGQQQAPMLPGGQAVAPVLLDSASAGAGSGAGQQQPQLPITPVACSQPPAPDMSPSGSPQPAKTPGSGGSWYQDELMATLMPEGLSLDKEQIAEQLRAAAPQSYDD